LASIFVFFSYLFGQKAGFLQHEKRGVNGSFKLLFGKIDHYDGKNEVSAPSELWMQD